MQLGQAVDGQGLGCRSLGLDCRWLIGAFIGK
jgi:hypothetical protein